MVHQLLILCGLFFLLVGCQSPAGDPNLTSETPSDKIVPGLPSISELAGTPDPKIPPLLPLDAGEIELGQEVYGQHCAECHGDNLEGEPEWQTQNEDGSFRAPPHDADGHTWHHGDEVLVESILLGGARLPEGIGGFSEMPAYGDALSEDEVMAVLTYIKSTWPEDLRRVQWEQTINEQNQ